MEGRTNAEAEDPILWSPDEKNSLEKIPDGDRVKAGGERTTEYEMVGWHLRLMDMSLSKLWEIVKDMETWHATVHGVTKIGHY